MCNGNESQSLLLAEVAVSVLYRLWGQVVVYFVEYDGFESSYQNTAALSTS